MMRMVSDSGWFVDQPVTAHDRLEEQSQIFSAARNSSGSKRDIEAANAVQEVCGKGHTCACAKLTGSIGMQRRLRMVLFHVKDAPLKAFRKAAKFFDPELCGRFHLERQDQASHAGHIL